MRESFVNTMKYRAAPLRGLALAASLLLACAPAPVVAGAQHEGHGAHGAKTASPKKKRKSAATPRRKVRRPSRTARRRARAKSRANRNTRTPPNVAPASGAHAAHQHDAKTAPVEQRTAPPAASTAQPTTQPTQPTQPAIASEPHSAHTGLPVKRATPDELKAPPQPAANPQATATPAPDATHQGHAGATPQADDSKVKSPQQPAATAVQPHADHGPAHKADEATKSADVKTNAPVDHSAHTGAGGGASADDTRGLMVMSGEEMGVRVGASRSNFMPMGQMASGTTWQPASSPMYMWHKTAGEWLLMLHGEMKLGVNSQGGPRGVTKFESQNWVMPMAFRRVGAGTLQLRGMFSLEPLTFSGAGSPQLFQTGEVYRGQPIRDFQHPHDLFMELSAQYTVPLGERATWYAYVGFPGEPALGPVAFMHRMSASENPTAPLAHHLQDSTHISMGVLTTGFTYRRLKVEASAFNGREPDDKRYNLEFNPWNSRSFRVTVAPNKNWAMQYSYGLLKNPEFFEPGDTHRQTASVQYNRPFERGNFAAAFIWGRNRESHDGETFRLNGYTAEATVNFRERNYLYTRLELVDREGDDLLTHDEFHDLGFDDDAHPQFRVGAYTFGAARELWNTDRWSIALGGDATFYTKPAVLDTLYGRHPTSYKIFLRIRPGRMKPNAHAGHGN